jgi:hypothetical protein
MSKFIFLSMVFISVAAFAGSDRQVTFECAAPANCVDLDPTKACNGFAKGSFKAKGKYKNADIPADHVSIARMVSREAKGRAEVSLSVPLSGGFMTVGGEASAKGNEFVSYLKANPETFRTCYQLKMQDYDIFVGCFGEQQDNSVEVVTLLDGRAVGVAFNHCKIEVR